MKKIGKIFIKGLISILPVALTLYIFYWLAVSAEAFLGPMITLVISEDFYVPGMGVAAGFLIVLAIGILLRIWLFRKLFGWGEKILERLPLIKPLYGSIRDLTDLLDTSQKKNFDKVVMVTIVDKGVRLMGLVTREDFTGLPAGIDDAGQTIAVYLPMSYQLGGFTAMVAKQNIQPIDMHIDQALRFIFTAAVSTEQKKN